MDDAPNTYRTGFAAHTLHVYRVGTGEPLVLVQGLGESASGGPGDRGVVRRVRRHRDRPARFRSLTRPTRQGVTERGQQVRRRTEPTSVSVVCTGSSAQPPTTRPAPDCPSRGWLSRHAGSLPCMMRGVLHKGGAGGPGPGILADVAFPLHPSHRTSRSRSASGASAERRAASRCTFRVRRSRGVRWRVRVQASTRPLQVLSGLTDTPLLRTHCAVSPAQGVAPGAC